MMLASLLAPLLGGALAAGAPHDPERLLAELSTRMRAAPHDAGLRCQRARLLHELGRTDEALAELRPLANVPEPAANVLSTLAALEFARGNDVAGLAAVRRAEASGGAGVAAKRAAASALRRLERADEAVAMLRSLAADAASEPELVLELAAAQVAAGDDDAALAGLDAAMARTGIVVGWFDAALAIEQRRGHFAAALARFSALPTELRALRPFVQRRDELLAAAAAAGGIDAANAASSTSTARVTPSTADAAALSTVTQPAAPTVQVLLPFGSDWRYFDQAIAPPLGWQLPGFDDSAWSQGPAQLGYGDGDEATVIQSGAPGAAPLASYFRRELVLAAPSTLVAPRLRLLCDDGAVAYVNGVEVGRFNLHNGGVGAGSPASVAIAGADENAVRTFAVDPALLLPGSNVLAVEVHQVAPTSSDVSFDLQVVAGLGDVAVVRGPYLQNATPSGCTVCWRTDQPTPTQLWLGASASSLQLVVNDPTPVVDHRAVVSGLAAETTFVYVPGDTAGPFANVPLATLRTLPPAGAVRPLRAWVLGDAGVGWAPQYWVRDAFTAFAAARPADAVLLLGDNAYFTGTDREYQNGLFDVYAATLRSTPTWSTMGNHDAASASSATGTGVYYDAFVLPANGEAGGLPSGTEAYYAFDRGHMHFVCLDSMGSDRSATGAMATWLAADLAATNARWIVAFFHHPPYSHGSHDSDDPLDSLGAMADMRSVLLPILEAGGVDLVLSGHSHSYERSFLLDGHHGDSTTLQPAMRRDRGDGRADGDGVYGKPTAGLAPHEGAVYVVAGSAGAVGGGALDHPVMVTSLDHLGSLVLDVDGDRLDATFVGLFGPEDHFTIQKGVVRTLVREQPRIPLGTGGRQDYALDAGAANAGRLYLLAGSYGSEPGFQFGAAHVPLNPDSWLSLSLALANTAVYPGSLGFLDAQGRANAAFVLPPIADPALVGTVLEHAFVLVGSGGASFASNPVRVTFAP